MTHLRPVDAPTPDGPAPVPEEGAEREPTLLDRTVMPYLRDPALWPVAFALLGHVAVVLMIPLLGIHRGGGPVDYFALFVLLSATWAAMNGERRDQGKLGPLSIAIGLTWALAVVMAVAADYYGVF